MRSTKEIIDNEMRSTLNNLMTSQISILRSIKTNELTIVYHYIVLMLAAIGFFSTFASSLKNIHMFWAIQFLILFFVIWFLYILLKERGSYYNLLRALLRIQNYLGLFGTANNEGEREKILLSLSVLDSGFPKGFGVYKDKDGTKPGSSFLARIVIVIIVYGVFLMISYSNQEITYLYRLALFGTALSFAAGFFYKDSTFQKKNAAIESGLLGFEDDWK